MEDSLTLHGIVVQLSFIIGLVAMIYWAIPKGSIVEEIDEDDELSF